MDENQIIEEFIHSHQNEMRELLEEIVMIESGSWQLEGIDKVNRVLIREFKEIGIEYYTIPMEEAGDTLIGDWNSHIKEEPIILMGHTDTVFSDGATIDNPFRVDEKGFVHGPGVYDMKGGLVIMLYTIRALKEVGYDKRPIRLIISGDEETLHQSSTGYDAIKKACDGARYCLNYESGQLDNAIVVGRKGAGIARFIVKGIAAHSGSELEKGRSAIIEASHKAIAIENCREIDRGKLVNIGMIHGGLAVNIVPEDCTVEFGFRFPTNEIRDEILSDINMIMEMDFITGTKTSFELEALMDAMEVTDATKALFNHFKKTAENIHYGELKSIVEGGASDAAISASMGIPTLCGMGIRGDNAHRDDEYAIISSLYERAVLSACGIFTLD